jgi:hypothetical protein
MDETTPRTRHPWTAERERQFIHALAASGSARHACAAVGLSPTSAYDHRHRSRAFAIAWGAALDVAVRSLRDCAMERAINGTVQPVFYKGRQVGERRVFDGRLTIFLLATLGARLAKREDETADEHEMRLIEERVEEAEQMADALRDLDGSEDPDAREARGFAILDAIAARTDARPPAPDDPRRRAVRHPRASVHPVHPRLQS